MKTTRDRDKNPKAVPRHDWTPADVQVLRDKWGLMPAVEIAKCIGGIVTKEAVLGKAHYIGLPKIQRGRGTGGTFNTSAMTVTSGGVVPKHERKAGRNMVPKPEEATARKPIAVTGTVRKCQWPTGHVGEPGFRFCGDAPVPGRPYCAEHMMVAYLPPDHPSYDRKPRTGTSFMPVHLRSK